MAPLVCASVSIRASCAPPTCRRRQRVCSAAAIAAPAQSAPPLALPQGEALKGWITSNGGFVHPALVLSETTPCGSRGVVALEAVDEADVQQPLAVVPEALFLTSQGAREQLGLPLLPAKLFLPFEALDAPLQLAVLLATERAKGRASYYWPYIEALPAQPPSAWMMDDAALESALQLAGPVAGSGWREEVASARSAVAAKVQAVCRAYGLLLPGLKPQALTWALAHVLSRCFGSEPDLALLPFIDCCNHNARAAVPEGVELEAGPCAAVACTDGGLPRLLESGDELYVSYLATCAPLMCFLSFGFVPRELQSPPQ